MSLKCAMILALVLVVYTIGRAEAQSQSSTIQLQQYFDEIIQFMNTLPNTVNQYYTPWVDMFTRYLQTVRTEFGTISETVNNILPIPQRNQTAPPFAAPRA